MKDKHEFLFVSDDSELVSDSEQSEHLKYDVHVHVLRCIVHYTLATSSYFDAHHACTYIVYIHHIYICVIEFHRSHMQIISQQQL